MPRTRTEISPGRHHTPRSYQGWAEVCVPVQCALEVSVLFEDPVEKESPSSGGNCIPAKISQHQSKCLFCDKTFTVPIVAFHYPGVSTYSVARPNKA